jgi:uncharacterized protein YjiS (DUF1127 family)
MVVPAERRRWRHIVSIQYATIPVKRRLIFKESEMAWTQRIEKSFPIGGLSKRELVAIISLWRHRARSRRHLQWLDERQLRDIGIDRQSAAEEARKPFWRA